jgi:hypothetical protein
MKPLVQPIVESLSRSSPEAQKLLSLFNLETMELRSIEEFKKRLKPVDASASPDE